MTMHHDIYIYVCHIDRAKGLPPEDSFWMKQTVVVSI